MHIFALPEGIMEKVNDLLTCQCSSTEELMSVLWRTEAIFTKQNVLAILTYLLNYELLVELVLSGLHTALPFDKWLVDKFPTNQTEYLSSVFPKLISRISDFLNASDFSPADWTVDQLQEYHQLQQATAPILQLLSELKFDSSRSNKHGKSAVKNLRRDRRNSVSTQDPMAEILEQFSINVPTTIEERDDAISNIIGRMKQAMKFYLKTLAASQSQITVMALFLLKQGPHNNKEPACTRVSLDAHSDSLGFVLVDRLKSFGDWKVFVSTRAERNLREAHRKAPALFNIIMKKIRELSQGYFTDDNQKRLNGPETDIPVFEAKMSRDTRLVYQIHCEYNYDTKVDEQVIRVFGIYNHARLGKRLWDSIGQQLGQKGSEYRRRCLFRHAKKTGFGDSVFVPATFPFLAQDVAPAAPSILNLPSHDLEEIHSILVLQKYMVMSEGLLQSILSDLNVTFPFHLSSQEREIVEYRGSSYILGRSGTGKTTCMLYKIIWMELLHRMHPDAIAKPRQLFVTKSSNLVQKVREEFQELSKSFQFSHPMAKHLQCFNPQVGSLPEVPKAPKSLPSKFSELEEGHFPLFISYDELLQLMEEDHGISFEKHWGADDRPLLSFSKFRHQYWPRLSHGLARRMDPNLVFNEIIGVIEGSEQSLSSDHQFLDRASYEDLSIRTNPTFAGQREELYSLFEAYQKCKKEFGHYDTAERTHKLLRKLYTNSLKGKRIDHLYVDEAQDNLLIDALVLRSFCHNADGLFWAGDTAQTILAGSSFRFEDLKSFLYRIEKNRLDTIAPSQKYLTAVGSMPAMFQLTTNYRSHMGITNCAHAVIELLSAFWPETIDALAPEQGVVDGGKPVFLVDWGNNQNAHILSKSSTGATMELGSNQCILVRNEEARESLRSELKNATIVTTIYDSKGLEFDDVLLLNFFEDSLCDASQWRLVLNNLNGSQHNQRRQAPAFDPMYHASLCTELKFLYVALTRARKTLWIADRSEKAEPMRDYWLSRDQIIVSTSNSGLEGLVAFSSPEDWAVRGEDFFQRGDYATAKQCFERAALPHKASEAHAHYFRQTAHEVPTNSKPQRRQAFIKAAEAFSGCAEHNKTSSESTLLANAGQCLALANEYTKAADIFQKVQDFDSAAMCYIQLDAFGTLLDLFTLNQEKITAATITKIRAAACPYYYRQGDYDNAFRFFAPSRADEITFLRDRGWTSFLVTVYIKAGQPENAARIHIAEKRVMQAIPLLLECQPDCTREAARYILNELWKFLSFSRKPVNHPSVEDLFKIWETVDKKHTGSDLQEEFGLLHTVFTYERSKLGTKGRNYLSKKNIPAALLCFSLYFIDFPTEVDHAEDAAAIFECFYLYTTALSDFTFPGPDGVVVDSYPLSFYLFGIRSASSGAFLCLPNTFLHSDSAHGEAALVGRHMKEGLEIPRSALKARFRQSLDTYLGDKLEKEGKLFESYLNLPTPCILINALGTCHRHREGDANQCRRFSVDDWRNCISTILAHSVVTNRLSRRLDIGIPVKQKSTCMNLLYKSLVVLSCGAQPDNTGLLDRVPAIEDGRHVVRYWSSHPGFSLDYDDRDILLLWFLRGAKIHIPRIDQRPLQEPAVSHPQWVKLSLGLDRPQTYFPPRHGLSLGSLIPDLEVLHPEHQLDRIETALRVFRMVLKLEWRLEMKILCDWIEHLTGLILIKPLWSKGTSKQVTLPLATAIQCINRPPDPIDTNNSNQHSTLFNLIGDVIDIVFSRKIEGRFRFPYEFSAFPATDLNVARICRAWCIIGYNYQEFTPRLLAAFKGFQGPTRRSSSLSGMYVLASTPQDLLSAVLQTSHSLDQRLIRLRDRELGVDDKVQRKEIKTLYYDWDQADQLYDRLVNLACPIAQAAQRKKRLDLQQHIRRQMAVRLLLIRHCRRHGAWWKLPMPRYLLALKWHRVVQLLRRVTQPVPHPSEQEGNKPVKA